MFARSLSVAVAALALAVPSAHAGLGDRMLPSPDGVTVGESPSKGLFLRFGPKAAKVHRRLAGERALVVCRALTAHDMELRWTRVPLKRGRVYLGSRMRNADLCTISTKRRTKDGVCFSNFGMASKECARVAVASTEAGRRQLDSAARTAELFWVELAVGLVGPDDPDLRTAPMKWYAVPLLEPDAMPPAGKVGYWVQGDDYVFSSLLRDGTRRFISHRAGVFSTNDPVRMDGTDRVMSIF